MKQAQKVVQLTILIALAAILVGTSGANAMEMININTASAEQLMTLDRVGAKYAQRIIEYRESVGPFAKPEDIMNVKGIGKKTWEANKDRIVI